MFTYLSKFASKKNGNWNIQVILFSENRVIYNLIYNISNLFKYVFNYKIFNLST